MRRLPMIAFVALALAVAIGIGTAVSPFASSQPDGLQRVAADHGFQGRAQVHRAQDSSPLAGYAVPGIGDARVARGLAGFAGTLGVFAVGAGLAWTLRRTRRGEARSA